MALLKGERSPEDIGSEIAAEVAACEEGFRSGGIGYIVVTDGDEMIVSREQASRLLRAIADDRLAFGAASYIADCVIMSDDFAFADHAVAEAIHFVEDDSRPPTRAEVLEALARLG